MGYVWIEDNNMVNHVWVLTRAINQYDQDGDYFVAAFGNYPTKEDLIKVTKCSEEYIQHILEKGGRKHKENEWYYLTKIRYVQLYD
jgi:hypothetical protein